MSHPGIVKFQRKPSDHFFKDNRAHFTSTFKSMSKLKGPVLFLKGPVEEPIYDDAMHYPVVPENFFYYMTGCYEANTYALYNVMEERLFLFVKLVDSTKAFWEKHKSLEHMKEEYHLQDVFKIEELEKVFREQVKEDDTVLTYVGKNPYSELETINVEEEFKVDARPP